MHNSSVVGIFLYLSYTPLLSLCAFALLFFYFEKIENNSSRSSPAQQQPRPASAHPQQPQPSPVQHHHSPARQPPPPLVIPPPRNTFSPWPHMSFSLLPPFFLLGRTPSLTVTPGYLGAHGRRGKAHSILVIQPPLFNPRSNS